MRPGGIVLVGLTLILLAMSDVASSAVSDTSRVSIRSNGDEGNGSSSSSIRAISDDGRYVTLSSDASNLVGGPERDIDLATVTGEEVGRLVDTLAGMTVEETATLPTLNPKRAETILGGVVVAEAVMTTLGADTAVQSIADTLDGAARELVAVT